TGCWTHAKANRSRRTGSTRFHRMIPAEADELGGISNPALHPYIPHPGLIFSHFQHDSCRPTRILRLT
ncbi:MAG: hypothetical protein PSV13_02545, partial [Lacunisphaera sp.]|nr:hypothetical protein [Lacunisphaera sp.]